MSPLCCTTGIPVGVCERNREQVVGKGKGEGVGEGMSARRRGCRLPSSSSGTFGQRLSSSSPVVSTPSADTHGTSTSLDWTS